ncbi:MAG: alpha/beta fold hydrolase [Burkholderiaceae bacterium]|nr:MAG: alpha/beta fold hydrolase [Burkholderiaceae bacterium]
MLARLQKIVTLSLLAAACAWLLAFWPRAPLLALAGCVVIVFGYAILLALEFAVLRLAQHGDPVPQPGWRELMRAWAGETVAAARVFCWWQPFRSRAVPDQLVPVNAGRQRRGIVLVHGFVCNRGVWTPWLRRLRASGHVFVAVNLEPVFGAIDDYAPIIEDAVQRVTQATGRAPLLVCHSMGGLATRAWLRAANGYARVHHIVTIGTPHHGTWLARSMGGANARQMRIGCDWQHQLERDLPAQQQALFTCWYSNCDNIVFPASTATLPGADNRLLRGVAHVQLALDEAVMRDTLAKLDAP